MAFKLKVVFLCLFLCSCSTKWGSFFSSSSKTEEEHQKLLTDFKVDEKVMEKFLEEPAKEEKKVEVTQKETATKKEVVKTSPKKVVTQKKETLVVVKKEEPKKESIEKSKTLPKNYPKDFIEINKVTEKYWDQFKWPASSDEEIYMDINYLGVTAGKIVIKVEDDKEIGGKPVYHVNARLKSAPFYKYVYELDDNVDSYILKERFLPLKFSLIQRESSQDIDDLQLFDHDETKVYWYWKRKTDEKEKKKQKNEFAPTLFQDPLSVVFFLRGLPLKIGDVYTIPIINKGKVEILTTKVEKTETIETELGKQEAIKVKAYTKYTGETLKSGDMVFWFSKDADHHFLKFKAKIKLGSISGDITKLVK